MPTATVEELEDRIEKLEQEHEMMRTVLEREGLWQAPVPEGETEREQILALVRSAGLLVEPSEWQMKRAKEWEQLPEEKKKQIIEKFDSLELDPLLSEIVIHAD